MTKKGWITRKSNEAAKRAASQAVAQAAVESAQRRESHRESRQSPSAATEARKSVPMPAQRSSRPSASPSASPELIRASELADYRRAVFGSASESAPFTPVIAPLAPTVRKRIYEFENHYYEDRELKRETQDVESYVCARGLCYRTKLHRIEVELVLVPSYPRNTIGIEYEVGEPRDGVAMWVPKNGLRIPYMSLGDSPSR